MHLLDTANIGWAVALVMATYTILRNWRSDSKAEREAKEKALKEVVADVAACKTRLDQNEREVSQLFEVVRKSADLNLLVAGLARDVSALASGLTEVKTMYRDLNKTLNDYFHAHRPR